MKKFILSILAILTVFLMPITAYAANEKCDVVVKYSSYTTPNPSDKFTITIKDANGNEQSFDINSYDLANATGSIELPSGIYTIVKLKYTGDGDVEGFGYAIPSYFNVSNDNSKKGIEIAIGHEQAKIMSENEDNIIIYQNNLSFNDITVMYPQKEVPEETDWSEHKGNDYELFNGDILGDDEGKENENVSEEDLAQLAVKPQEEISNEPAYENETIEPEIEEIKKEEKETPSDTQSQSRVAYKKSLISRIIILTVLIVIVGILLLILKKKGKI